MELTDLREVQAYLTARGFRFSKSLGQNFLIDATVPERIAQAAALDKSCGVLEIGPGLGALTQHLCARAGKVVAVEKDRDLPDMLRALLPAENLTVLPGDILKTDLAALAREHFQGLTPVVCANLPYNITTPVITALLESGVFESMTLMVQREVASRICATPERGDYGAFSVFVAYHCEGEVLFDVGPESFLPRPKVTSSVLWLRRRAEPPQSLVDEATFFKVVRGAFAQRRKTLVNSLQTAVHGLDKPALTAVIEGLGFPADIRGEKLSIPDFARLAERLKDFV